MAKVTREKFKTMHNVFDEFTNRTIYKLINQGHFEGLESPISIGKEANIFSAVTKWGNRVIVKIYRLEACDSNKMYEYIRKDPRFGELKGKKRIIIFHWVQREYRNMLKARNLGAKVPTAYTFLNNVIVMEFIGKGGEPAPKLKDLAPKNKKKFFDKMVADLRKMYLGGLVHADASAFNVLNYEDNPVFIDFSQGTVLDDPDALTYLKRDVFNLCNHFQKIGLKADADKTYEKIVKKK